MASRPKVKESIDGQNSTFVATYISGLSKKQAGRQALQNLYNPLDEKCVPRQSIP